MDDDIDHVAERTFVGISRDGERLTIRLRIGEPYAASDVDWACPVVLDGLCNRLADIHGVDSLQSLLLAIRTARSLLADFVDRGGSLYWPDEESSGPISIDEIFHKVQ